MSPEPGSSAAEPLALYAPVAEVTLFEDRARVVRRGRVSVPAGRTRIRIGDVAPVLADATLTARVESGPGRTVHTRVTRRLVPRDEEGGDARAALERELDEHDAAVGRQQAALARHRHEAGSLARLAGLALGETAVDAAWGREDPEEWASRLDRIREREREARLRVEELQIRLAERERERDRLRLRLAALDDPARRHWAGVDVVVEAEGEGEVALRVEYLVPGACWRPWHTAELDERGERARLTFRSDGCVWQNTGEDWTDVRLHFSTQRVAQGTDPPRLTSDVLAVVERQPETAVETREVVVSTTGLGAADAKALPRLPGIDTGGRELTLEASSPATIPSDGRPWRIPLLTFETGAETDLAAWPERVEAALRRSRQLNAGALPVLAGPVDLIRAGGYSGRTSVLYVAPGERFELAWGVEPDLRLRRDAETTPEKRRLPGAWPGKRHRTRVAVTNLGAERRRVHVIERVPVSEIDKVEVEVDAGGTSGGREPDDDGLVSWDEVLEPGERRDLDLRYTVRSHPGVSGL